MKFSRSLITCALFAFCLFIFHSHGYGQDAMDHTVIKPMPKSVLIPSLSKKLNFSSYSFRTDKGKKVVTVEKKGKFWKLHYIIKNAQGQKDKRVSRTDITQNYKAAAMGKGGAVLYERKNGKLTFTLPIQNGGTLWTYVAAATGSYDIFIIEEAGFKRRLTFGADEMKKALDEKGNISLYGINFDINKDNLQLGAEKMLTEIVKLLKNSPGLKIEIQGHTDNTGSAEHNLVLSKRRAETVKKFLVIYGIDSLRMIPKGYGMKKPVAANDTQEGRAMNRRVELVKRN